jgi:hypothetical protein
MDYIHPNPNRRTHPWSWFPSTSSRDELVSFQLLPGGVGFPPTPPGRSWFPSNSSREELVSLELVSTQLLSGGVGFVFELKWLVFEIPIVNIKWVMSLIRV